MNMTYMTLKEYTNTYNNNMDEYHWHFVDWNKFDIKEYIFFNSIYMKFKKNKSMIRNQYCYYLWGKVGVQIDREGAQRNLRGWWAQGYTYIKTSTSYTIKIHTLYCTVW